MKKRICSLLLICSMLAGLLPQIVLPQAAAADTAAARDGFGLPTEEKTGITDPATLRNNPYGTLGWVPLFQNHELVVAGVDSDEFQTTYEGAANGKGGQMSTFRWSNSTDVGNAERIATVAFDPNGTGKDEYIANLVFDKSSERLRLYVTNKDRRVSEVVQIGDGNDTEYIKKLKFYQTRAMLSLAAGDFDGDGKDTLMIYTPGNNKNTYTVDSIKEYTFSGSKLTDNGRVINLGDVIDGGQEALKAMLCHDGNGDNELRAHLSVDMEVGDVDMDGIDELAMTVNVNDLKESEYKLDGKTYTDFEKSYLTVYDYNNSNKWSQMTKQTLLNSSGGARGRARFAGVTIGYVSDAPSGSMPPEVVAVGYYDKKDNYRDCEFDTSKLLAYSYQYSTKDNSWTEKIKATEVVTNGFTNTGTKGDDVQNPIAVAAVAADGVNSQEYLFISGSMYKVGTVNGSQQLSILDGSDKGHDRWLGGRLINNSGILDYAVGNFDGNKQGMEQVYYVEYRKQEAFDKQFLKIGQLYKGSAGSTFSRWEDDWTYYDKGNCNLAIATADVNNDAMLAKIKSVSTGYTDPKVMAILEASPHFAEVNDGDIGNSQTGIGYSKDHSETVTASGSFGFDIMAGFEYVAPLIETGGGVEFNTSHTFTVGATKSTSKEITVEYSNDTNDNMVLMYATPMTYYEYQVKYPDGTKKGNSPKLTSSMTLAVPGSPSMNMVSVDTYNKAASAYEGMQQIGSNLHLGTSGQPNTYRSSLPSGKHLWASEAKDAGHYRDSGTKTQRITTSTGSSLNFEYSYEGSVQMYGVVGGFKAGGGYHWGASVGTEKVNTNSITKEGTVTGGGDSRYNFDWSFGTWTVPFNGDEVPVLGYVVSNVTAPPSPAQDLSLSEQTTNSMVLSWQSGDRPAEYYKIYRYLEDNKEEPFVLIDTVDAAESSSGEYEYTLKDLAPNAKYQYAITSGYYTSQEESVESEIIAGTTLANDKSRPDINGPYNVTVQMNGSATFDVLASVPAEYSSTRYQWQQRLPGKKWGNIAGSAKGSYSYYLKEWSVNGGAAQAASGNTLALTEIRRNTIVKAVFDGAINYDVTLDVQGTDTGTTVAAAANGKAVTPQKNSPASVTRGSKVVFTATPAVENGRNKQMVAQWTVNGVDRNNISNELVIPSLTGKTDVAVKFVPYEGFAIPTGGTGWKVSDVKRVPNDTQPTSKIRKNGELTFTVGLASDYTVISKLVINGYDCINGKLAKNATLHGCDAVEARKNANGSYTVTIKNVTAVPDMSVEAHRVIIGSLTVPEKFKNIPELDTVEKIQAKLTAELTGRKDGVAFYDIALKYYDGSEWIPVNENNFPAEGVDVVLPYPNGTDSKDTFQIVHMLTKTGSEGEIEKVDHTKEIDGLRFHVTRLSPFGVSWTKYTAPTPGGGGGGGGGAVAPTTYDIVIPSALANTVKADKTKAAAGDTVTLTAAGEGTLTVTDANGKTVALTDLGSGKYTFKMPSAKVSVGFKTIADQPCDGGKDCPSAPFTDVDTAKWYHLSVDYVLAHKMMNGVSSRAFAPNANLTRGMLVQILYNLEGKPKGTAANFSDVQADAWYAEAVGWAASDKVVTGYADGTFRPNAAVTREQTAAILYRYAQSKGIDVSVGENTNILSYVDVQQASEYAIPALQWAVGAGVLNGKNGGRLAPTGTATRAEIAAIMQRWCENIIK